MKSEKKRLLEAIESYGHIVMHPKDLSVERLRSILDTCKKLSNIQYLLNKENRKRVIEV